MQSRLELVSAHGDQTLSTIKFVVHGSSRQAGQKILESGLSFIEGRPTASSNLLQAYGYATDPVKRGYSTDSATTTDDPGLLTVIAVPPELSVGYGVFTTSYIDRQIKRVYGAPLRYAGARKQIALYQQPDTETRRRQIEVEVASGFALTAHPSFVIGRSEVVGAYRPAPPLQHLLTIIEVVAKELEPLDEAGVEAGIREAFEPREPAQSVMAGPLAHALLIGTIESVVMSRLRIMRWQGLSVMGYRFQEGQESVVVAGPATMAEQQARVEDYGRRLASSSLLSGELAWLRTYAVSHLEIMRVELEGAASD